MEHFSKRRWRLKSHNSQTNVVTVGHRHLMKSPLIGLACLPLLTLVVMLPATIKHAMALYAGQVYWFTPRFSAIAHIAAGPPTVANERSISLWCLCGPFPLRSSCNVWEEVKLVSEKLSSYLTTWRTGFGNVRTGPDPWVQATWRHRRAGRRRLARTARRLVTERRSKTLSTLPTWLASFYKTRKYSFTL